MKDKESQSTSKLYGYLLASDNNGDLVMGPKKDKTIAVLNPMNQVTRSINANLSKTETYPKKINVLCANMDGGEDGEGSFNLQVFVKGKTPTLEKIN